MNCLLSNIEFYNTPDGTIMVKAYEQPVRALVSSDRGLIQAMLSVIRELYPDAFSKLAELYSRHERNHILYEFNIVSRFIRCNFGEYDQYNYDIDHTGTFHFEEVRCPLRGTIDCAYEGCICKPILNTNLTEREKEVLSLIGQGLQSKDVANELHISITTVHRHRENIKAKLKLKTVGELVNYWMKYFNAK